MNELITLRFSKQEIEKLLGVLQYSISHELEILQDNSYALDGETFVVFLESIQEQTETYLKLSDAIKPPAELEE